MRFSIISLSLALFQFCPAGEPEPSAKEDSLDCRNTILLAKTLDVYEGLPHPSKDRTLFEREIKREDVTKIWNYPFYTPGVSATNADKLKRILSDPETLEIREGPKRCLEFHPDYDLAWKEQEKTYHALICFGCSEIVFFDGKASFVYDLNDKADSHLKELLSSHAKKRPPGS